MLQVSQVDVRAGGCVVLFEPGEPRLPAFLEERRRHGRARNELALLRKDGTHLPVEVSSSLLELQGGSIEVASAGMNRGSEFTVSNAIRFERAEVDRFVAAGRR